MPRLRLAWWPGWKWPRRRGPEVVALPGTAPAPWEAIYAELGIPRTLHYPRTTLGRLLEQTADRFPDSPAVIFGQLRWTYAEVLDRVRRAAGGLGSMGIGPGDRVLMTLPNCPEFIVAFFALQELGAVVVNAGPLMGVDDLRGIVALTGPRAIVALDLQSALLAGIAPEVPRVCVSLRGYQTVLRRLGYRYKLWQETRGNGAAASGVAWETLLAGTHTDRPRVTAEPEQLAVLQPTGGTTGTLKVAQLSHRNLVANAMQVAVWGGLRDGQESMLGLLPMFHAYGLTMSLITPVLCGGTMLPMARFRLPVLIDILVRHRPTVVPLVPAAIHALCEELTHRPRPDLVEALHGHKVLSGAAPLPAATAERFEKITGVSITQGYGLTEASPGTHCNPTGRGRADSIGVPLPDTRVRIADLLDESVDAMPGEAGELMISGPQVFGGYYRDPEQTNRVLMTDPAGRRWLRTGDVVRMDADGLFYVVDRRKDMINRGGEKVWPARVEAVLMLHPKVADAAVVGRPDGARGERVVAIVATAQPVKHHAALVAELKGLCAERLGPHEVPSEFEFAPRVPRSELGKLLKYRLRDPTPPSRAA